MAKHFWLGRISTDHSVAGNWSLTDNGTPGVTVPATGDDTEWTGTGGSGGSGSDNPCDITANFACANFAAQATYTARLDLLTADVTLDSAASIILDNSIFDMGTGTLTVDGATFDNQNVVTFSRGTSTLVMSGTGTLTSSTSNDMHNVTIDTGAITTVTGSTDITNLFSVNGSLVLNSDVRITGAADCELNTDSIVSGAARLRLSGSSSGHGITVKAANSIVSAQIEYIDGFNTGVIAAGDYLGVLIIRADNANTVLKPSGGYTFGSIVARTNFANTVTMDNSATTSVTTGDLTIDLNSTGSITITDGATTEWIITGDIINQVTGSGDFDWPQTLGNSLTAQGNASQFWDIPSISTIADVIVAKDATTDVQLNANLDCNSFAGESGKIDLAGFQLQTTELVDWQAGFEVIGLALSDVVVGGDFTADGQALISADPWTLTVTGTAVASGAGSVQNSDASGGTTIQAVFWTDNGNNTNWNFLAALANGVFQAGDRKTRWAAPRRQSRFAAESRATRWVGGRRQ